MDLSSIVLYLRRKGLSAKKVHLDIVHTLWSDAVAYSSVTLYLREVHCAGRMDSKALLNHDHEPDDSYQAILTALSEQPFASIPELSRFTQVSKSAVHRPLMQSLHFRVRDLH
jgi:hypothetical protein